MPEQHGKRTWGGTRNAYARKRRVFLYVPGIGLVFKRVKGRKTPLTERINWRKSKWTEWELSTAYRPNEPRWVGKARNA